MTNARAHYPAAASSIEDPVDPLRRTLLTCGIFGAALYPLADILVASLYPGFSYRDQAVSELFAIGAPTSAVVVPLFSLSSALIFLFAIGIWLSADGRRRVRLLAVMMALNAVDALLLWNFFPMHMRGAQPTFTDTMHGALAIDPFLLAAIVLAAMAFPGRFRFYTIATVLVTAMLAFFGLSQLPAFMANQATPWMGAFERAGQYINNFWYAVLAVMLLRQSQARPSARRGYG
jgi:hypothetical protein